MLQPCQAQGTLVQRARSSPAQLPPWLEDCRSHAAESGRGSSRDRAGRESATDEDMLCSFPRGETRLRRNLGFPLVRQLALPACMAGPSPRGPSAAARPFACHTGEPSHHHLGTETASLPARSLPAPRTLPGWTPPALGFQEAPILPSALSLARPPRPDPKPEGFVSLPRGHSLCKGSASTPASKPACSPGPSDPVSS